MANKQISSTQNQLIKHIVLLKEKSRERKKTKTFVTEGEREIQLAINGQYTIETVLYFPEIYDTNKLSALPENINCIEVTKEVYQKIAYRDTTEGIVAILNSRKDFS